MKKNNTLKVALVQMASGGNEQQNMRKAVSFLDKAAAHEARLICFPEVFHYRPPRRVPGSHATIIPGSLLEPFQEYARRYQIWILAGSVYEKAEHGRKGYNSSTMIGPNGKVVATYRKIHLFDAVVNSKTISESDAFIAGTHPVIINIAGRLTGLSICYDLRFPELYRRYSAQGAMILCVPSSFTSATGKAHWEVLLRARAIENQCFVLASNQCGVGGGGVRTYGNSMVIDPWGRILARASERREEIIYATLDFSSLKNIRTTLPSLTHRVLS